METPTTEQPQPQPDIEVQPATQKDIGTLLDAVKELTKTVGDLVGEWQKWRAAGKF